MTYDKLMADIADRVRDELRVAEGDAAEWKRRYDELVATRVPMERITFSDMWREVAI